MAEVKIYSTPTCPHCKSAKKFFAEHNIPYKEFNVSEDRKALDDMIKRSRQMSVPVIDIDGELMVGFDEEKVKRKIGLAE